MKEKEVIINLNNKLCSTTEEKDRLEKNIQVFYKLVIPDEVALALGDSEREKNPEEIFFLF